MLANGSHATNQAPAEPRRVTVPQQAINDAILIIQTGEPFSGRRMPTASTGRSNF